MNYRFEDFDHFLKAWTEEKGVRLFTRSQDYEIRAFNVGVYEYLLTQPSEGEFIFQVFHSEKNQKVEEFKTTPDELSQYLEKR